MKFLYFLGVAYLLLPMASKALVDWRISYSSPPVDLQAGARFQEVELEFSGMRVRVYAVLFNEKKCRLRVLDNPSSRTENLAETLKRRNFFAGTNGAYFHTNFTPVGLVISGKKVLHRFERARLLTGVLEIRENSIRLVRSETFRFSQQVVDALQAGPFLVEQGRTRYGLNATRVARRTIMASDGYGNWALISMTPLTLAQAGALLTTQNIFSGWRSIREALNLDGGSSTAFWVATKPAPFSIHEFGIVKNFLGLTQRNSKTVLR